MKSAFGREGASADGGRVKANFRWLAAAALVCLVSLIAPTAAASPPLPVPPPPSGVGASHRTAASRIDTEQLIRTGTRTKPGMASPRSALRSRASPVRVSTVNAPGPLHSGITTNNWSGYYAGGNSYTAVAGTFNVPSLLATTTESVTSEWVGIDGVDSGSSSLIQAGVDEIYEPGPNSVTTQAWWEILPAPSTPVSLPVVPGDSITVTIWLVSGTTWAIEIDDNTTGQFFKTTQSYTGPQDSADWIVEAPTSSQTGQAILGHYSPNVSFTKLGITGNQTAAPTAVTMVQGGVIVSQPSAFTSSGFTVSYVGSATPSPTPSPTPTPTPTPTASPSPTTTTYTITQGQYFDLRLTGGSPGLQVQWQVSFDDLIWSYLATITLDSSGNSSYTITPSRTAYYRIFVPSTGQYSNWQLQIIVQPAPVASASATALPTPTPSGQQVPPPPSGIATIFTVTLGQQATITQPGPPNTPFKLQTSPDNSTWTDLASLTTNASGSATYTFTPTATAFYRSLFPSGPTASVRGVVVLPTAEKLTLNGPGVITWGSSASLTITVTPPASRLVTLLSSADHKTWSPIGSTTTASDGMASFAYRPGSTLWYRAEEGGATGGPTTSSQDVRTLVRLVATALGGSSGTVTVRAGTTISFATAVRPSPAGPPAAHVTFRLYHFVGKSWKLSRSATSPADSTGLAVVRWKLGQSGRWYETSMAVGVPGFANSAWTKVQSYLVQ
jgi:hypothetical protein